MSQPKELQDNRRGTGPWDKNRHSPRLGIRPDDFGGSPLSRVPEKTLAGIMPIDQFVKDVVVPFGQRVVSAQDRVAAKINQLLNDFPSLSDFSGVRPSNFVLAAETAGFTNAEQLMYASTLRQRYDDLKNLVDQRISRLSQRSLAPGVPVVVLDTFYPKDKATGDRHLNKRTVLYAASGTVGGLTLAGIILEACNAVGASQGHPASSNPNIPIGPGFTPTPEGGVGVHPLVVVCPNPTQMGDQKYPLSVVTPKLQGIAEYHNVNDKDAALVTQLNAAINKKFGPNDLVICSPAYGEGVSPVVNQVTFDRPTGEGNWFVLFEDGRLVGPKEDRLFTPDNKWVQANDVSHYSLGRVGEGKFDSMVFTAPRKNPFDPEIIVGILDRQTGRVLTGKEMIDKYGGVFSNIPYGILASLDQFRQSIPANLLSQVDHFGYVPTPTPDGKTGLKLAALRSDDTVVLAQGQEIPKATITPSLSPKPTETVVPTATPIQEVLPLNLSNVRNIDVNSIPPELFGTKNATKRIGEYLYGAPGANNALGKDTIVEKLPEYPGFSGSVVHVNVLSPSPIEGNQRPYMTIEDFYNVNGPWAYEVSHLVLKAPSRLVHTGWMKDPIVVLTDVGIHRPNHPYWMVGGVRLLTDNGKDYFVSVYRVNLNGTNMPSDRKIPFALGVKQKIRTEIYYDSENGNKPTLRAFLVQPNGENPPKYDFIGKIPLDPDVDSITGTGIIVKIGDYTGQYVTGLEDISGEAQIFR